VVDPIFHPKYGFLYNWYVVDDARSIANIGWRVQNYPDYNSLASFLGGFSVFGNKTKEEGLTYWNTPNTGATNSSKYNARGAGIRNETEFIIIKESMWAWGLEFNAIHGAGNVVKYNSSSMSSIAISNNKIIGASIRLIKDSTTLSDGESATYTGNDGKLYRTICIGTQEWLADNLAETKYRNGDWIPGFDGGTYTPIADAAWAALTTGALCAYDDDTDNV
jgi:uncharacterized protein (TIGR02145 family)